MRQPRRLSVVSLLASFATVVILTTLAPADIAKAPAEVREAYRFAIANRDTLRYIPCYCGCGSEGHTSNASCYVKDSSTRDNLIFDRMSLA